MMTDQPETQTVAPIAKTPPSAPAASSGNPAAGMRFRRRFAGGILAAGALTILCVAAFLTPSASGLGTHRAMNLPPCGWIALADTPCPTCGMTTAFAHAANGSMFMSLHTQPMGFLLAITAAIALLTGIYVATTGSSLLVLFVNRWRPRATWALSAFFVTAWIYKVMSYREIL